MTIDVDPFELPQQVVPLDNFPAVQLSFFLGKDQVVVRGHNGRDVQSLMEEFADPETIDSILASLNTIRARAVVLAAPEPPAPAAARYASAPSQQPAGVEICVCGAPRRYVEDRAVPPTWAALYCPKPAGQQCTPRSVKTAIRGR